ncbi:uracil-DNA glycosylase [Thermoanaerobacterium sp. DL9XJH110]|uniref:uracil-DNA glycosylase n=1 Tax=Thermoanaerobacterium sp. DL9XJH110 TaxID=3386643 RepID=UPI003BB8113F
MAIADDICSCFHAKEIDLPDALKLLLQVKQQFNLTGIYYDELLENIRAKKLHSEELTNFLSRKIKDYLYSCTGCPLHRAEHHTQKVPGEGCLNSPLVLIGEGPGFDEDRMGRPFVGRAGQLLTTILNKLGVNRERVYITNVVKCRPPMNRTPFVKEIKACSKNLELELSLINPKVIIALGAVPLNYFMPDSSIMRSRGQWIFDRGYWIMPTYHPAYILRQQGKALNKTKWEVWGDFNKALEKVRELSPDYKFS